MNHLSIRKSLITDGIMIALALTSIVFLVIEVTGEVAPNQLELIRAIDNIIAGIFFLEFIYKLVHASDRKKFFKRYWWELLASIPLSTLPTQALRSIKLFRFIPLLGSARLVRFVLRLKVLFEASIRFTKQTYLMYISVVAGAVTLAGAIGFHHFEGKTNPAVQSFFDSFWWAMETVTSSNYGDIYPTTVGGRLVAMVLMLSGVAVLGAFIAVVDAYLLKNMYELHQKRFAIQNLIHKE